MVSTTLPQPLIVKVLEANGTPAVGVRVTWTPLTGGGRLSASSTPTNGQGLAQVTWTLGSTAGSQSARATATATGSPITFTATATSGTSVLALVSGTPTGAPSTPLAQPLVVQVTSASGPVSGATVDWMVVTSGGGTGSAL